VAKAEPKPLPAPPPPKPAEARVPLAPPPVPEHKPRPKPELRPAQQARAEAKPEVRPKPEPRPEAKKTDPVAFSKLLHDLETPEKQEKRDRPDAFDSLLKNLTKQQTARAEEPMPAPKRMAALSPPSAQPKAPLGTELTASEIDIVRQQLSRCWDIPAGARDARDLVVTVRGSIAPDGRVLQADIVDKAKMSDSFFRAAAESARRAFFHPLCTPLRLPLEKYEAWKTFEIELSPKDIL
jgi:outer membrane biosynthesis protein TonB